MKRDINKIKVPDTNLVTGSFVIGTGICKCDYPHIDCICEDSLYTKDELKIILNNINDIIENQQDMPEEYIDIVNEHFWDLFDDNDFKD